MENKKDIGTIFREKINHLDKSPNDDGWNSIQLALDLRKRRKYAYYWLFTILLFSIGILSSSLFFFTSLNTNQIFNVDEQKIINEKHNGNTIKKEDEKTDIITSQKSVVTSDQLFTKKSSMDNTLSNNSFFYRYYSTSEKKSNYCIDKKIVSLERNVKFDKNKKSKIKTLNNKITLPKKNQFIKESGNIEKVYTEISLHTEERIAKNTIEINIKNNEIIKDDINNQDSIKKNKVASLDTQKDTITTVEQEEKLFNLFIYASPTYTLFSSDNSTLDMRLNTNSKKSKIIFNYGIYFSYQATENFSIRFGIGRNKSTITTKNALINTANYSNIEYKDGFSNTSIFNQSNNSEYMNITQEISYSEIPIEVKYNLINNKIGVNAIIGLNYLFLSNNEVSITADNGYFAKIGKTAKLLSKTFGTNVGIGVDYKISPRVKINIEPMLKYQFNSKNNLEAGNVINFNILTGLEISLFNKE